MYKSSCYILKSTLQGDVVDVFNDCISQLEPDAVILRISVFWGPESNHQYDHDKHLMNEVIAAKFGARQPGVSYIAQQPLDASMTVELVQLSGNDEVMVSYRHYQDMPYVKVTHKDYCELHISGVSDDHGTSVGHQTQNIFKTISTILKSEGMAINSIVRQWNYIERITDMDGAHQRYQLFNDERTSFYEKTDWPKGFPAATGIGMQAGGVVVDCLAVSGADQEMALANPLQTDAHAYTQSVLIGAEEQTRKIKTTPKFERAKLLVNANVGKVYVSGTAAIRGEGSIGLGQAKEQTQLTLENINQLVAADNIAIPLGGNIAQDMYRVYVKKEADYEKVKAVFDACNRNIPVSFLLSDICRDELLVEIEAILSLDDL